MLNPNYPLGCTTEAEFYRKCMGVEYPSDLFSSPAMQLLEHERQRQIEAANKMAKSLLPDPMEQILRDEQKRHTDNFRSLLPPVNSVLGY